MKCLSCGKTVPEKKFCVFCGARLLAHCPKCNKIVEIPIDGACPSCNTKFLLYEEGMQLIGEAKALERRHKYEEALYKYENAQKLLSSMPLTIKKEISKQIQELITKIDIVTEKRALGEKAIKTGAIVTAKKAFQEVQKIIPTDEHAKRTLTELAPLLKRKAIRAWSLGVIVVAIAGVIGWEGYRNTLSYCVKEELVKLLNSQSLDIRTSAAFVLAMHKKSEGVSILRILSNSNDERKRLYSLTALLPFSEAKARNDLRELLYNGSTPAKIGAGWALINDGDTLSAVRLGVYLTGNDEDLRIASAVLLFDLGYAEGMPEIEKNLSTVPGSSVAAFKTLYAMYLLGDKDMLASHIGEWAGRVRELLKDKSEDVRLTAAFLLNKVTPNLAKEDSTLIESILWSGFLRSKDKVTPTLKELPEVQSFYLAKDVINNEGDEELSQLLSSARQIRQVCQSELSKIELGDKGAIEVAQNRMNSNSPMEQLYGATVSYRINKLKAVSVFKKLLNTPDENIKLLACKTAYEFIIQ